MSLLLYYWFIIFFFISFILLLSVCVFFFKQKTAYEMRISDWSSDVCSSDLLTLVRDGAIDMVRAFDLMAGAPARLLQVRAGSLEQIGRASCRERVCQYV